MAVTVTLGSIVFGGPADSDGDRFTLRDLIGWTTPAPDLVLVDRPLSDGAVVAHSRYKPRTVIISGHGIATTPSTLWRVRSKLAAAANLVTTSGTLTVAEPSATFTLAVWLGEAVRDRAVGPRVIDFEITLVAPDPAKVPSP